MNPWKRWRLRRWLDKHIDHGGVSASLYHKDDLANQSVVRCKCGSKVWL